METSKGTNDQSFVAIDQFEFLQTGLDCGIIPDVAKPTEAPPTTTSTTTTTTPPPPTTPAPTEPPGRKFL